MSDRQVVLCYAFVGLMSALAAFSVLHMQRSEASTTSTAVAGERTDADHRTPHPTATATSFADRTTYRSSAELLAGDPEPSEAPSASDKSSTGSMPFDRTAVPPTAAHASIPPSQFDHDQIVAFYGSPISDGLGILGTFSIDDVGVRVREQAGLVDDLNGDRGVKAALDLIYAQVQSQPTENGLYLAYLPDWVVRQYISVAERFDLQLILDLQIGRDYVVDAVAKIEPYLENPRVHVAIDPEYAVGPEGIPLVTPGRISGDDLNAIQKYLSGLVARKNLPSKLLVVHQYLDATIERGEVVRAFDGVDLVLNMDGFGHIGEKERKYHQYAARPYAQYRGFNIFLRLDDRVMSEDEVLRLSPAPDMIFYQ